MPMIEREDELRRLVEALAGPPAVAVVEGESGIGKTRLVREAVGAVAGRRILVGEAHPVLEPFPLGPVLGALLSVPFPPAGRLSAVAGSLRALLPERAGELPEAPPPLADAAAERHRVMRGLVELLGAFGPAVLVLEDLHWTDDRTLDLLAVLGSAPPPEMAVVLTFRGDEVPPGAPLRRIVASLPRPLVRAHIDLAPLSAPGVGRMVAGMLGSEPVSEPFAQQLREETGGNPFVVEESVRLLEERGLLVRREGAWDRPLEQLHVPPAVAESIVERLDRVGEGARELIEAAAVLALPGDERLLGGIAGRDPAGIEGELAEAMASGLLVESAGRVGFRHALARGAVYGSLAFPRRRALHLAAARELEALEDPALLARVAQHHREGGAAAAWARTAEAAADVLARRAEDRAAFELLRELLESSDLEPARRGALTVRAAWAARPHEDLKDVARRMIEEALRDPELEPSARGELHLLRGWELLQEIQTAGEGLAEVRAALGDLAGRADLEARALSTLAMHWVPEGSGAEHYRYLAAAREAAARARDPLVDAAVAADAVSLLLEFGDPHGWAAVEALPPPDASPQIAAQHLRGLLNAAFGAIGVGHHERALELSRRAAAVRDEHGIETYGWVVDVMELAARWSLGDVDGLALPEPADFDRAMEIDRELVRGEMLLEQGSLREAGEVLTRVAEEASTRARPAGAARAAAGALRVGGEFETRATAVAETVVAWSTTKDAWVWVAPLLIELPLERVTVLLDDYRAGIADRDAPLAQAALAFAQARLSGDPDGFAQAREAASQEPRLAARAAVAEAEAHLARGDRAAAEPLFRTGIAELDRLGSSWTAGQVRARMREVGFPVARHRSGRRGYGETLSPRERQVAERVAAGLTAREIGEELFLSARTVEGHIARAMRKLGVSSRRDVAAALERVGS